MNRVEIQQQKRCLERASQMLAPGSDFETAVIRKYEEPAPFVKYGVIVRTIDAILKKAEDKFAAAEMCFDRVKNEAVFDKLMRESRAYVRQAHIEGAKHADISRYIVK